MATSSPTRKLVRCERHPLGTSTAVGAIVLVFEGDAVAVERDQPAVGDGDAVGIARQIGQHRFGSGERSACSRHATCACAVAPGRRRRPCARRVRRDSPKNCRLAGRVGGEQLLQHQPTEQPREHAHRQEEAPAGRTTQRVPSSEMPPPGTIMCTCGWWVIAEPQVCSTAVMPMRAPRCLGSAAIVQHRLGRGLEQQIVDRRPCSGRRCRRSPPAA